MIRRVAGGIIALLAIYVGARLLWHAVTRNAREQDSVAVSTAPPPPGPQAEVLIRVECDGVG